VNSEYTVFGKPNEFKKSVSIPHPEMELAAEANQSLQSSMQAVYNTTEKLKAIGLESRGMLKLQKTLQLQLPPIPETIPANLLDTFRLMNRHQAYQNIHFPESAEKQQKASFRL